MNIGIASSREYLFFYKTMLRSLVENNKNVKDGINVYPELFTHIRNCI